MTRPRGYAINGDVARLRVQRGDDSRLKVARCDLTYAMYPAAFDYTVAESVDHAIGLLRRSGEGAKLLSGGQSLVPLMKLRLVQPTHVIDIGRVDGLSDVRVDDAAGVVCIGALATHAQVGASAVVQEKLPLMTEAAGVIGDAQVRGWGTLGGALAEADPAGDWGPVAQALEGRVECTGPSGVRVVDAASFFVDAYTTVLADDEVITELQLPVPSTGSAGAYLKMERRAGDFAVASVAVQLELDGAGTCTKAGVALGAAGLTPIKAVAAEATLGGQPVAPEVVDSAAERVVEAANPLADVRGSSDYKRAVCGALFRKAVDIALRRHRGESVKGGHVR